MNVLLPGISTESSASFADPVKPGKGIPRVLEVAITIIALLTLAPIIVAAALAVAVTSSGPVIFRQRRVGLNGTTFIFCKLRTMRASSGGPQVTSGDDRRITRIGRILRKTKLDELPSLWHVIKGDMSLVGPRPEVPRYVDLTNPHWALVLSVRPGITDPVTMRLRNEEALLETVGGDRERFYLEVLQPLKLKGYLDYLRTRNWWCDVKVLCLSGVAVVRPGKVPRLTIKDVTEEL